MAQAVRRRLLTAKARVRAWISLCGICGGQSGTGTRISQISSVLPVNIIPPRLSVFMCYLGVNNSLVGGRSSETPSHHIDMNKLCTYFHLTQLTVTNINWLMLFKEMIAVYSENHFNAHKYKMRS
jgi:hypothetical protein